MKHRIVKVGGSLLDFDGFRNHLKKWLELESGETNVLVMGCGPLANLVRQLDRKFQIGQEPCHWACVELLASTARLLHGMLPESVLIDQLPELQIRLRSEKSETIVFDPSRWIVAENSLPQDWSVTTDSIAAKLADRLDENELVLLKSVLPTGALDVERASSIGLVDEYFPQAIRSAQKISCVNLRDATFPSRDLETTAET